MIGQQRQDNFDQSLITDQCQLCQGQNFEVMLNRALYDRYLSNMDIYYIDDIDDFIEQQITPQTCKFRQQLCDSNEQELLKRQYAANQFQGKIQMLSEYYKFHRDIPKIFEKSVFKILGKYYDRLRHYDYKKIKCLLKQQQGISLTTQKSDQSSHYSDQIIKSRYSTVLHDLNKNSQTQSQILFDFCEKVDKALDKVHFKKDFKGQYYSGQKKFEQYLLSMKKINSNKHSKTPFTNQNMNMKVKNYNLLHKPLNNNNIQLNNISLKSQRVDSRKKSLSKKNAQITFQNNNALKQSLKNFKKNKNKNLKSTQKTTANQTISRDQKSKRLQKLQKTLQYEIQKNQNHIFKPFSTTILGLKSNAMLKTLDQIYKPSLLNQKYHSDKSRKTSNTNVHQLNRIYQNKLTGRKSTDKITKPVSYHNSKDINSDHKQIFRCNQNEENQLKSVDICKGLHNKQPLIQRKSSTKRLSRSKSTSKALTSNKKSNKNIIQQDFKNQNKKLKTIDQTAEKSYNTRLSSAKIRQKQNILENFIQNKQKTNFNQTNHNWFKPLQKPHQIRQRSNSKKEISRKSIGSAKKQRSKSKSNLIFGSKNTITSTSKHNIISDSKTNLMNTQKINLHSSQRIKKNASKSNIHSARGNNLDKINFQTIDPDTNKKNIENFVQRKLKLNLKNNPKSNKFFN